MKGRFLKEFVIVVSLFISVTTFALDSNSKPKSANQIYDEHVNQAKELFKAKRFDEALAEAQAAEKLDSKGYLAHAVEALILNKAGKPVEAKAAVDKALKLAPADKQAEVQNIANRVTSAQGKTKAPVIGAALLKDYCEPTTGMEFVLVEGGEYEMGCGSWAGDCEDYEKPAHTVKVNDFYMGRYEVTNVQFKQFIDETGYKTTAEEKGTGWGMSKEGASDWGEKAGLQWRHPLWPSDDIGRKMEHPVLQVSWHDAKAFTDWLSKKMGKAYRLPTEAEWEYAARSGGDKVKYVWGDGAPSINGKKADNIAEESLKRIYSGGMIWNGYDDGYVYTSPVGVFAANKIGLYDMGGNVCEWCSDWYAGNYYKSSPYDNPQGSHSGAYRVIRGGSWSDAPGYVRAGNRNLISPEDRSGGVGFRLSRTP